MGRPKKEENKTEEESPKDAAPKDAAPKEDAPKEDAPKEDAPKEDDVDDTVEKKPSKKDVEKAAEGFIKNKSLNRSASLLPVLDKETNSQPMLRLKQQLGADGLSVRGNDEGLKFVVIVKDGHKFVKQI